MSMIMAGLQSGPSTLGTLLGDKITTFGSKVIAGIKKGGGAIGKFYDPVFQWGDIIKDMKSNDPDVRNRAKTDRDLDIFLKTISTAMGLMNAIPGKKWDAIIGPLPVPMVTYYDFAESDSIVKYRSMGGEFFAHQGGDKTALRIDILLVGPEKELFMHMLRALRLMCKSQTRGQTLTHQDESYLFDPINKPGEGLWRFKRVQRRTGRLDTPDENATLTEDQQGIVDTVDWLRGVGGLSPNGFKVNKFGTADLTSEELEMIARLSGVSEANVKAHFANRLVAVQEDASFIGVAPAGGVDPLSIQRVMATDEVMNGFTGEYLAHSKAYYDMQQMGYYTYHVNFPVIVDNMIFTDMWLETVQFTHDSKMGVDAIIGHLLLRKWIAPPRVRWSANANNISRISRVSTQADKKGKSKVLPASKWVWVWQDKVKPTIQVHEFKIGLSVGIARAVFLAPFAAYKYMNAGFLQTNHRTVSVTAIFS